MGNSLGCVCGEKKAAEVQNTIIAVNKTETPPERPQEDVAKVPSFQRTTSARISNDEARNQLAPLSTPAPEFTPEKTKETTDEDENKQRKLRRQLSVQLQQKENKELNEFLEGRQNTVMKRGLSFIPKIIQTAIKQGVVNKDVNLDENSTEGILIKKTKGAVAFTDASGFTALTERLAQSPYGAEMLSDCLNNFMTPLISIINKHHGDVIKFSGDAISVLWPYEDDDEDGARLAILRASACCVELHDKLHNFDTGIPLNDDGKGSRPASGRKLNPITSNAAGSGSSTPNRPVTPPTDNVKLTLHIGVGMGEVYMFHVGGKVRDYDQYEYVLAGPPMAQISIAEPLAASGETVLSPEAWEALAPEDVQEGEPIAERSDFHRLVALKPAGQLAMDNSIAKLDAMPNTGLTEEDVQYLPLVERYIPRTVFLKLSNPTGAKDINEMRNIAIVFIQIAGIKCETAEGLVKAQKLMRGVQEAVHSCEGSINKFLVDDKGLLILAAFGLPPTVHSDDKLRAVIASQRIVTACVDLKVNVRVGVTFGRAWCGIMGSIDRHEYTFLGDDVNLAARLMCNAKADSILVNTIVWARSKHYLHFEQLPQIKVKGKNDWIQIYEPKHIIDPKVANEGAVMNDSLEQMMLPWSIQDSTYGGPSPLCLLPSYPLNDKLRRLLELAAPAPAAIRGTNSCMLFLGDQGLGKVTLLEHALGELVLKEGMTPCYSFSVALNHRGVLHPIKELVHDLIELDPAGPTSGKAVKMANQHLKKVLPDLTVDSLRDYAVHDNSVEESVIGAMVQRTMEFVEEFCDTFTSKGLVVVLRAQKGTALFEHVWEDCFWKCVVAAVNITKERRQKGSATKPLTFLIAGRNLDKMTDVPGMDTAINWLTESDWVFKTDVLPKECVIEYVRAYLKVSPKSKVSDDLMAFVEEYGGANSRNITECLAKLQSNENITITQEEDGTSSVDGKGLDSIDVAKWEDTTMVTDMQTVIERLRPDVLKVLKVACELKDFEPADIMHVLMAYSTSKVRNFMDDVIVFKACKELVAMGHFVQTDPVEAKYRLANSKLLRSCVQALLLSQQRNLIQRRTLLRKVNSTITASFSKKTGVAAFVK